MWAAGFGSRESFKKKRYAGANAGKLVHTWIEARLNKTEMPAIPAGTTQTEHDEAHQAFKSWEFWMNDNKALIKNWTIELKMLTDQFGGTCDVLVEMNDGSFSILDWKTSKVYSPTSDAYKSQKFSFKLQLAAYASLIKQTRNIVVNQARIIHLSKTNTHYSEVLFTAADLAEGWKLFEKLLHIHQGFTGCP